MPQTDQMKKRIITKEDGRYLIFYAFERPFPPVHAEKSGSATREGSGAKPDEYDEGKQD